MRPTPQRRAGPPALGLITAIGSQDSYLAVVSTLRSDGTPHSSLVNAAVLAHPITGAPVGRSSPTDPPSSRTCGADPR